MGFGNSCKFDTRVLRKHCYTYFTPEGIVSEAQATHMGTFSLVYKLFYFILTERSSLKFIAVFKKLIEVRN
jgi:hypothetical protein